MAIKKWFVLFASFLVFQNWAYSGEIFTTVFNVIESTKTERLLVLSGSDGRIYKTVKTEEAKLLLESLVGQVVKLSFIEKDKEAIITEIRPVNPGEIDQNAMDLNHFQYHQLRQFAPSDLKSAANVKDIFQNLLNDGDKGLSQCFKRAHMWSYDMWTKLGIKSQKIFIFYTKRFQALEDFQWWFHVAPMVEADGQEFVLDPTFMDRPVSVQEWVDYFMRSKKITCPVVDKYQDYENHQWKRLCYLMKVPMYHFRPLDIELRDKKGEERNHWLLEELQNARRAFRNFNEIYEGLNSGKPTKKY